MARSQVIEPAPCPYKIETIPIGETLRDANDITRHQPVFCRNRPQKLFGEFQCGRLMIVQHDLSIEAPQIGKNWRPIQTAAAADGEYTGCSFPPHGFVDLQRLAFQLVAVLLYYRRLEQNLLDMPPERIWYALVRSGNHILDGFK